jgi:hypothetical protein
MAQALPHRRVRGPEDDAAFPPSMDGEVPTAIGPDLRSVDRVVVLGSEAVVGEASHARSDRDLGD